MPVTIYISIYEVYDERDPNHWAIYLQGSRSSVILQVSDDKGGVGYYVEQPMYGKQPQRSSRHRESIAVGSIPSDSFDAAVAFIQSTQVDNQSNTWNCQAWTVEALNNLAAVGLFQWDARAYQRVLQRRQNWQ